MRQTSTFPASAPFSLTPNDVTWKHRNMLIAKSQYFLYVSDRIHNCPYRRTADTNPWHAELRWKYKFVFVCQTYLDIIKVRIVNSLGSFLLTWINFNSNMDASENYGWSHISMRYYNIYHVIKKQISIFSDIPAATLQYFRLVVTKPEKRQ